MPESKVVKAIIVANKYTPAQATDFISCNWFCRPAIKAWHWLGYVHHHWFAKVTAYTGLRPVIFFWV